MFILWSRKIIGGNTMIDLRSGDVFDTKGNLRSSITFRWIGEVMSTEIKIRRKVSNYYDEKEKDYFSLVITDKYGFTCSFWRRDWSLERLRVYQSKIPYKHTLIIEGDINIRRGTTYFNIDSICKPDGTPVALYVLQGLREEGEESGDSTDMVVLDNNNMEERL
jgi:hypothetical protein